MPRDLNTIRNIGIIAHIDAGKTTLTERMLYYSGTIHRMGEVDYGTTTTDFDPEEQQRGITIYSACVTFKWLDKIVNLIDTPGHVDFTAEVERSLRVLDGGVVVFSAREGVEAQSETVWRQADKYRVPRLCFINKLDREGADFRGTVEEMKKRLGANPVIVQMPVGEGPSHAKNPFRAIIDLVRMKLLTYPESDQGAKVVIEDIPEELQADAEAGRAAMLERLYDYSDDLMNLALAEEPVPEDLLRQVIRSATVHNQITPVFCGSALHHRGVQQVLDGAVYYLPSPADVPPVEGVNPKKKNAPEQRRPDPAEPFCALVFKIQADKHGDLHFVRVYSGELKANSRVLNSGKDKKENVAQLWHIQADRRQQVERVEAGDIVGIKGLRESVTGDTLCAANDPILLESIAFPETVISMAIEPESSADRKKLADTLEMMKRQDPTFRAQINEETGQTLISGMGELHLEIITHRLKRDFNLNIRVHKPRVSYRETVEHAAEVVGACHRTQGGQSLFAEVKVRVEPLDETSAGVMVTSNVPPDTLPEPFLRSALDTLKDAGQGGGYLGFPLLRAKFTILGGTFREDESTEVAFAIAAGDAFHKALAAAGTVLLEPIMKLDIVTPEENLGDFISDLQQRRALISRTEPRGSNTQIIAEAPLSNLFGYSSAMRGLSQGRASCSMEPAAYRPAPNEIRDQFLG